MYCFRSSVNKTKKIQGQKLSIQRPNLSIKSCNDVYEGASEAEMYNLFETLLDKYVVECNTGDKVLGTVVSIDSRFVYLDLSAKKYAILPHDEVSITEKTKRV